MWDVGFSPAADAVLDGLGDWHYERNFLASEIQDMVRGFIDAVSGDPGPLTHMGRPQAVDYLLAPPTGRGEQVWLVVREPQVLDIRVTSIDTAVTPATVDVVARLRAYCWKADRYTGALRSGYQDAPTVVWLQLTIAPEGQEGVEWQIIAGHASTDEEVYGYRFVTRPETDAESLDRAGSEQSLAGSEQSLAGSEQSLAGSERDLPVESGMRSYRIHGSWVDHDYRVSGDATRIVALPDYPDRSEAERLLSDVAGEAFRQREPDAEDFRPSWSSLEAVELRP